MTEGLAEAVEAIRARTPLEPVLGVVLGSGLGGFADAIEEPVEIPYEEIPGWPRSTAVGHAGTLVLGTFGGVPVAAMKGRAHLYEGHAPAKVVFGIRVLGRLGLRTLVLTNACGAVNTSLVPGQLVLALRPPQPAGHVAARRRQRRRARPALPGSVRRVRPASCAQRRVRRRPGSGSTFPRVSTRPGWARRSRPRPRSA